MRSKGLILILSISLTLTILSTPCSADSKNRTPKETVAEMHNLIIMMNHGFMMVMNGLNLVMISELKISPELDFLTGQHGYAMFEKGKDIIAGVPSEGRMVEMLEKDHNDYPLMIEIQALGKSMLQTVKLFEQRIMTSPSISSDRMAMHHMQILLTHALRMAVEGANMVMLGSKQIACDVNDFSTNKGRIMMIDARTMVKEIEAKKEMKDLHDRGRTADKDHTMRITHELIEEFGKIMDILAEILSDQK